MLPAKRGSARPRKFPFWFKYREIPPERQGKQEFPPQPPLHPPDLRDTVLIMRHCSIAGASPALRDCTARKGLYSAASRLVYQPQTRLCCKEMVIHRRKATGASPALRAGDRAMRGSGFASGPGASRRGCSAPLLSLALPKKLQPAICGHGVFAARKPQGLVTAGILPFFAFRSLRSAKTPGNRNSRHPAGLKQRPPCHFWAFGVFAPQNPQELETAGILPA
jgi:hypothetical protein